MDDNYSEIRNYILTRLKLYETEDGWYIVEDKESGRFFKVNSSAFFVLSMIQNGKNITEILLDYNFCFTRSITSENLNLLFQRLENLRLSNNSIGIKIARKKKSPIIFRVKLLSEKLVSKLARFFIFLFDSKLFSVLFVFSTIFVLFFIFTQHNGIGVHDSTSLPIKFLYFFLLLFFQLFHEIGHASAGLRFGVKAKEIGFGFFYGVIPVFYSDLTRIWTLPANKRIIVNLGGIYLDFLISSCSILLWYIIKWDFFLMYPYVIVATTLHNLNIFIRYDGYWALTDMVNSDNLQGESNRTIFAIIRERRLIQSENKVRLIFMIVYGLLSYSYIAIFMFFVLFCYYKNILSFPSFVWSLISNGSGLAALVEGDIWGVFIFPLLFYIILSVKVCRYMSKRITPRV